jgi:lipoprotein-anchoring transpeptidase ErfK/SrfK
MSCKPISDRRRLRAAAVVGLSVLTVGSLSACNAELDGDQALGNPFSDESSAAPQVPQVQVQANVRPRKPVHVDHLVKVTAAQGTLDKVVVRSANGKTRVPGTLAQDGTSWQASGLLEPGMTYRIQATAQDEDGLSKQFARTFKTDDLSLDEQTYPSLVPADGDTVGVAMPVILRFDVPVEHKAAFERHLSVRTTPAQPGSWHWMSDTEVHWRPRHYWKPGTKVDVTAAINSVDAGNGVYGQEDRTSSFTIGDALRMKINLASHQMKVTRNGELLRTIPITGGKPGFTTRSGTKVIIEKFTSKRMDAATTGINPDNPEYYNLSDVKYAQRVTYSGEFLHAAPWSVGSQGYANVSHGCVGMSTSNAEWLFGQTKVGDPVEVTGSDRPMDLTNGYGDWNESWQEYRQGSALH